MLNHLPQVVHVALKQLDGTMIPHLRAALHSHTLVAMETQTILPTGSYVKAIVEPEVTCLL